MNRNLRVFFFKIDLKIELDVKYLTEMICFFSVCLYRPFYWNIGIFKVYLKQIQIDIDEHNFNTKKKKSFFSLTKQSSDNN